MRLLASSQENADAQLEAAQQDSVRLQRLVLEHAQTVQRVQGQALAARREADEARANGADTAAQLAAAQAALALAKQAAASATANGDALAKHHEAACASALVEAREEARALFAKLRASQERESELRGRLGVCSDALADMKAQLARLHSELEQKVGRPLPRPAPPCPAIAPFVLPPFFSCPASLFGFAPSAWVVVVVAVPPKVSVCLFSLRLWPWRKPVLNRTLRQASAVLQTKRSRPASTCCKIKTVSWLRQRRPWRSPTPHSAALLHCMRLP
jgi:hypothetical protein